MTVVITHFPSPYQVELFDEIERQQAGAIKVLYLFRRDSDRGWKPATMAHPHDYLDPHDVGAGTIAQVVDAEFVVFNYYNDGRASRLRGTLDGALIADRLVHRDADAAAAQCRAHDF